MTEKEKLFREIQKYEFNKIIHTPNIFRSTVVCYGMSRKYDGLILFYDYYNRNNQVYIDRKVLARVCPTFYSKLTFEDYYFCESFTVKDKVKGFAKFIKFILNVQKYYNDYIKDIDITNEDDLEGNFDDIYEIINNIK